MSSAAGVWAPPKVEKFYPAVIEDSGLDAGSVRHPEWHVLRCVSGKEKLLLWFLDRIGMPYRHLTYWQKVKHGRPVRRSWLPGYLLLEFDRERDRWQQVVRFPHAISFLGGPSPVPPAVFEDLVRKCPEKLERPNAFSCLAPGTLVRIKSGPFAGNVVVVSWSDRKTVKAPMLAFGSRDVEITLRSSDVEVVV